MSLGEKQAPNFKNSNLRVPVNPKSRNKFTYPIMSAPVADCLEGSDDVQIIAMEILGHLAGMAESLSPFQLHQARNRRVGMIS